MDSTWLRRTALAGVVTPLLLAAAGQTAPAKAGALIQFGNSWLGVNDQGHLNFDSDSGPGNAILNGSGLQPFDPVSGAGPYGIFRSTVGDATSPGCLCEGWGVAVTDPSGIVRSGGANEDEGGPFGLTGGSFGSTANTATSQVSLSDADIQITHAYGPSTFPDVFVAQVTILNTGSVDYSNVTYRRVMDWDVPPTEFDEYVTNQGVEANLVANGGNVLGAHDNGFVTADPVVPLSASDEIVPGTFNSDFVDAGPDDHGAAFDFLFGSLAPGERQVFNIFYGTAPTETVAINAVDALEMDVYSFGQSNPDPDGGDGELALFAVDSVLGPGPGNPDGTPATFIFGFKGVGGVEPGSTPENPIIPFVPAPLTFTFDNPEPRRWYDPPFVEAFTYTLLGDPDAVFLEVGVPPASFGYGPIDVVVDGLVIATLMPGETFLFDPADMVTMFTLAGIDPLIDAADPLFATLFPTFLDFTGAPTSLSMVGIAVTAAPVPASLALMAVGLAVFGAATRRRPAA